MALKIMPHGRLQEWVAEEKGYFTAEGLEYSFVLNDDYGVHAAQRDDAGEIKTGAFETFGAGRDGADVSCACHWATNTAASEGAGHLVTTAYSVAPCGIVVPPESPIRRPEDLAGVEVGVGYHSGSHFATLQALEAVLPPDDVKLTFQGPPNERLDALLGRQVQAAWPDTTRPPWSRAPPVGAAVSLLPRVNCCIILISVLAREVPVMDSFTGKIAVVTGGGSGMGRELVFQLAAQGCSVATCDINADTVAETEALARAGAAADVRVASHVCDVADEAQVLRFRDELLNEHDSDHVDLVFSNAGIGGGGSFIDDSREEWERVFAVDWWGVYYCARAFLPLLIASSEGVLVNTSSVNGFWAAVMPGAPQTAYSTAKFAVKGFSEALIEDLRVNAPHVRVALVMPGHVGTNIVANSLRGRGLPDPEHMSDAQVEEVIPPERRAAWIKAGALREGASADDLRKMLVRGNADFRDKAPVSAAEAATIILDGVRAGTWRILIGKDAKWLDTHCRAEPEAVYEWAELGRMAKEAPPARTP